uniref:Tetraspanin family protein n=2 Tax=Steinernema glaseri TaxID=37863 RepID=A0A1I7Z5A5_9BILA
MVLGPSQVCCCGRMDVKTGALVIGMFYAVFGFLCLFNNFVVFTIFQESPRNSVIEVFLSIAVIIVGVLAFDGSYNNRSRKLIPLIIFMLGQMVFFSVLVVCFIAALFNPDLIVKSPMMKERIEKITIGEVRTVSCGLALLISALIGLSLWFLSTLINCYRCIRAGKRNEETEMGHFENIRY